MKWNEEDLKKYISAKEYIDTAIIPLQAVQLSEDAQLERDAFQAEVLSIYANEIEKELSGRVLLMPTYHYLKTNDLIDESNRFNGWVRDLQKQPFKEVFAFTFEPSWRKMEKELDCHVLWFPGMKDGNVKSTEAVQLIRSQVEQISELIRSYW